MITTSKQERLIDRLVCSRNSNSGYVIGYHGTSAQRASLIAIEGFENRLPEHGTDSGVYFWDQEFAENALEPGERKAIEDNDPEFAVITAELYRPLPDYDQYRPQWLAKAGTISIQSIAYYDLATRESGSYIDI